VAKELDSEPDDAESAVPFASLGPSLLESDAGAQAATIVDEAPSFGAHEEVTADRASDEDLDFADPTAISDVPAEPPDPSLFEDAGLLEDAGPTRAEPMRFERTIDAAGMKPLPSMVPMARAGLRVKESIRGAKPPPPLIVGTPMRAPEGAGAMAVPQRAIPTALVRERPRASEAPSADAAVPVDDAVAVRRSPKALWFVAAFLASVALVLLLIVAS
jgi:hypothetical protein